LRTAKFRPLIGCGCLSLKSCPLLDPDDEAAEIGPGSHYLVQDKERAATRR